MSPSHLPVERRWPILVLGLLLLFQAAGLFGLGSFYLFTLTSGDTAANLPGLLNSSAFNLLALLLAVEGLPGMSLWALFGAIVGVMVGVIVFCSI